jgi:hypothetical protein
MDVTSVLDCHYADMAPSTKHAFTCRSWGGGRKASLQLVPLYMLHVTLASYSPTLWQALQLALQQELAGLQHRNGSFLERVTSSLPERVTGPLLWNGSPIAQSVLA